MTDVEKEIGNGLNIKKSCVTFNLTLLQQLNEADCLESCTYRSDRKDELLYILSPYTCTLSHHLLLSWRVEEFRHEFQIYLTKLHGIGPRSSSIY